VNGTFYPFSFFLKFIVYCEEIGNLRQKKSEEIGNAFTRSNPL
jgi:hypothetical protein